MASTNCYNTLIEIAEDCPATAGEVPPVGRSKRSVGVPVQIHGMDAAPFFVGEGDIDAARTLVEEAEEAELFLYPGDQHYFADSSLPSYDAAATTILLQRALAFLAGI